MLQGLLKNLSRFRASTFEFPADLDVSSFTDLAEKMGKRRKFGLVLNALGEVMPGQQVPSLFKPSSRV